MYNEVLKLTKKHVLDLAFNSVNMFPHVGWQKRSYDLIRGCLDALDEINKYSDFYGLREEIILILNFWDEKEEKWNISERLIYRCLVLVRNHGEC